MFDLGMSEMAVLGAVALIVVGPKDLPKLAREVGKIYKKMRGLAGDFRGAIDQLAREAELDDITNAAKQARGFNAGRAVEDFIMSEDAAAQARTAPPAKTPASSGDTANPSAKNQ